MTLAEVAGHGGWGVESIWWVLSTALGGHGCVRSCRASASCCVELRTPYHPQVLFQPIMK